MKSKLLATLAALLLAVAALAGPYHDLDSSTKGLSDKDLLAQVQKSPLAKSNEELKEIATGPYAEADRARQLRAYLDLRSDFETNAPSNTQSTPITEIKKSPLYRKSNDEKGDNWLKKAIDRIDFNIHPPQQKLPQFGEGPTADMSFLLYIVIGILAAAILVALFFAIRHFSISRSGRSRGRTALVEEDEPERTLDEWLEMAAKLEAEGRYREAVRCLYVANLLRLDEYRVIRFDRTQTNWEHYRRLVASPKNPTSIDLLGRTREFDRIWYGGMEVGVSEVHTFRQTYQDLSAHLARKSEEAA